MLSFANAIGNLFNRWGRLGKVVSAIRTHQLLQLTNMTDTSTGVVAQFNAESDLQALMGASYIGLLGGVEGAGGVMQSIAAQTANRMVFRDNPRIGQTLSDMNIVASLQEIIRQMKVQGATVLAMTITATPSNFVAPSVGNGVIVASVRRPFDGLVLENSIAENLLVTCSADSFTGGQTSGNESFVVTGTGQQSDVFAFNWPLGSGATQTLTMADGSKDNGFGNILTNSDFETWASSVPSSFTIVTNGSTISQETGIVYTGSSALKITGDGTTQTEFKQQFGSSSGTTGTLSSLTQYAFNVFTRRDGTAPAAGILTIDLVDSNDVVIKDANGVDNSFTIDLTALTMVYTSRSGVFRTPYSLPSTYFIRFKLTTPLTNTRAVYFDRGCLNRMTQIYTSGPFLAGFSGSIPFVRGDFTTAAITNSRGAAGTLDTFQTLLPRLMPEIISNEFLFPSSGTPTISDLLITS